MTTIERHRTAMRRTGMSRPMQQAFQDGLLEVGTTVFDFGCGHGGDLRLLNALGMEASGWDPAHRPDSPRHPARVVNLGYVINVIEDPAERSRVIREAWRLTTGVLVVAARLTWDRDSSIGRPHGDGRFTAANTFQKFFEPEELRGFVEHAVGQTTVAAAPGIVYVFRDPGLAQGLLARSTRTGRPRAGVAQLIYEQYREPLGDLEAYVRESRSLPPPTEAGSFRLLAETFGSLNAAFTVIRSATGQEHWTDIAPRRRTTSQQRYLEHFDLLQPLIDFVTDRGRLPHPGELPGEPEIEEVFGSCRAAFSVVRRVTDPDRWALLTEQATTNFLVYCALSAFGGRPKFGDLPADLQHDAKDLFGSYREATERADRLLHSIANIAALDEACRQSPFGKLTPEALYVHVNYVDELPPLLRVYQGAARHLTGMVDDATILKLHRLKPQVSFLVYPEFGNDPHPALEASIVARLPELRVRYRHFGDSENPPILHRKESFLPTSDPSHGRFARLSRQEERAGLLGSNIIGTRRGWEQALRAAGYTLLGHQLRKVPPTTPESDEAEYI